MPGRKPAEAVRAFLQPLQDALACVADGKLSARGGLSPRVGTPQQWSMNNGGGVELLSEDAEGLTFYASMYWEVIEDEHEGYGPYRVTTRGYDHSLVRGEATELWAMHWHPAGPSGEKLPHVHLGDVLFGEGSPVSSKNHLRTGRMTFETAIRWTIEFGAMPLHDDWEARLALAEAPHMLYRTWSADPGIARP